MTFHYSYISSGRIVQRHDDAAYCYRCSMVGVFVCLSIGHIRETRNHTKTAELIEVPFGVWTRVGPNTIYHVKPWIPPRSKFPIIFARRQQLCACDCNKSTVTVATSFRCKGKCCVSPAFSLHPIWFCRHTFFLKRLSTT